MFQKNKYNQIIKFYILHPFLRKCVNLFYNRLNFRQQGLIHSRLSRLFNSEDKPSTTSYWEIIFLENKIILPLRKNAFSLDWNTALSILGHDVEVKQTYAHLIKSHEAPTLFIDVGANFGLHSLLFLSHGIQTLTFEPDVICMKSFKDFCTLNRLEPNICGIALGDKDASVKLYYPKDDTWLGTIDTEVKKDLQQEFTLSSLKVEQRKIDNYLHLFEEHNILIKIDAEGSEYRILQGGEKTLKKYKPKIIFESRDDASRTNLFNFFSSHQYSIINLPLKAGGEQKLNRKQFEKSSATNFIAISDLQD